MVRFKYKKNSTSINFIIELAVILRLIMLVIIMFSGQWESSFIGEGLSDDWKYEVGAEYFAQNANGLFDRDTFTTAYMVTDNDSVGYNLERPFSIATFWYLIVCFITYFTKTKYCIRLFNIFLTAVSMIYIYKFSSLVYGERTAERTLILYAFLPYPVIMNCFGYKEELAMFCTFFILYKSAYYRYTNNINAKEIVKLILVAVLFAGIRSGVSIAFFAVCSVIMFVKDLNKIKKNKIKLIIISFAMVCIMAFLFIRLWDVILMKLNHYMGQNANRGENSSIDILMINNIYDIWKFPLSYMYSILMPFGLFIKINSWSTLVSNLNVCMIPIAIGATIYIFTRKKPDKVIYWGCFMYYAIYILTSLNVFRQLSALFPLSLIAFSDFSVKASKNEKSICVILSLLMFIATVLFYGLRA